VQHAGSGDGAALIAFAYVRFMGDLAGGVLLNRVLSRTMGLAPLHFYTFPAIADLDAFRASYRAALDRAGAQLDDITPVVNAALEAFRLDIALSVAVAKQARA
jgi:heme oxygenase